MEGKTMLTSEDEDILRNFDRYLAQAAIRDPVLAQKSASKEGAFGIEYAGKVDEAAVRAAFATDFLFIAPSGRAVDQEEMTQCTVEGEPEVAFKSSVISSLESDDSGDSAWMTGVLTLNARMDRRDISGQFHSSSLFVKRNGQWQQVLLHLSRVASPAPV
jgi:Domain of unknown function (DUF4440)